MHTAYIAITLVVGLLVAGSGLAKIARKADVVKAIHELLGVPMKYFSLLALCEIAGAIGLVMGIWWPLLGVAAGIGLVLYFVGAVVPICG
jgi:DoxX-like family